MTPAEAKNLREMKWKYVQIKWRDPADDWPYYRMLDVRSRTGLIKVRGMDFPDGSAKHDGDEFWADWSDVREIEPVMVRVWVLTPELTRAADALDFTANPNRRRVERIVMQQEEPWKSQ